MSERKSSLFNLLGYPEESDVRGSSVQVFFEGKKQIIKFPLIQGLGWLSACLFSDHFQKYCKIFPSLFKRMDKIRFWP